jgi:serine/threonine-protein kinase
MPSSFPPVSVSAPRPTVPRVVGRFLLVDVLGAGGMGKVFLAVDASSSRGDPVALKWAQPDGGEPPAPGASDASTAEATIALRLRHPNVVRTFAAGVDEGVPYLVMELLVGADLATLARAFRHAGAGLSPEACAFVVAELLAGLHALHTLDDERGAPMCLVHRDVTPRNVFVTTAGEVKLLDFGVVDRAERPVAVGGGGIRGTLSYTAPEAVFGDPVDVRADVFSAGVILWELLSGVRLFAGHSSLQRVTRLLTGDLPSPRAANPHVPEALEAIVMRALSHEPEARYSSAREMEDALRELLGSTPEAELRETVAHGLAARFPEAETESRARIERARSAHAMHRGASSSAPPSSSQILPPAERRDVLADPLEGSGSTAPHSFPSSVVVPRGAVDVPNVALLPKTPLRSRVALGLLAAAMAVGGWVTGQRLAAPGRTALAAPHPDLRASADAGTLAASDGGAKQP